MTTEGPTHWATVTWYGIQDLSDTPFAEVLSGSSEAELYRLCHVWAHVHLSEYAKYKVQYGGESMADRRENDPCKNIPLSTEHEMTPRQRANFEAAERELADLVDHTACPVWRAVKQGASSEG